MALRLRRRLTRFVPPWLEILFRFSLCANPVPLFAIHNVEMELMKAPWVFAICTLQIELYRERRLAFSYHK